MLELELFLSLFLASHYLQLLDRAVLKSLKSYYYEFGRMFLKRNS